MTAEIAFCLLQSDDAMRLPKRQLHVPDMAQHPLRLEPWKRPLGDASLLWPTGIGPYRACRDGLFSGVKDWKDLLQVVSRK